jgi:hypothetical protein
MAITIFYDSSRNSNEDGTPFWASHKEFRKLGPNSVFTATEVEDDADASVTETPCVQNLVDGYVLIDGPYDAYDVIVGVQGLVVEKPTVTGTGRVFGGLTWRITDDKNAAVASGKLAAPLATPVMPTVPFAAAYMTRVPNGKKTRVCGASTAGGITIPPAPTAFYASAKVDVTLAWWVQPMVALIGVGGTGAFAPIPVGGIPGLFEIGGDLSFGNFLQRNIGGLFNQIFFQRATEDFQDPQLRKSIGLAASTLEMPETQERLEQARQTIGKPFRER